MPKTVMKVNGEAPGKALYKSQLQLVGRPASANKAFAMFELTVRLKISKEMIQFALAILALILR